MREIPFFSVQQTNRVDYVRFRHCKAYFKQRSGDHGDGI